MELIIINILYPEKTLREINISKKLAIKESLYSNRYDVSSGRINLGLLSQESDQLKIIDYYFG